MTEPSPRFLKAKNIRDFTVGKISEAIWKMNWLEKIKFDYMGKNIKVPKELQLLDGLKELSIYAKNVNFNTVSNIETLSVQGCHEIVFSDTTELPKLEKFVIVSLGEDFNIASLDLFRVAPKLQNIVVSAYVITRKQKEQLQKKFVGVNIIVEKDVKWL